MMLTFMAWYSCGTVALYGLFIKKFYLADHRATDFTRSKICGTATKNTSHLSTVFFTTKRKVNSREFTSIGVIKVENNISG
jgi:hypothetical protein